MALINIMIKYQIDKDLETINTLLDSVEIWEILCLN